MSRECMVAVMMLMVAAPRVYAQAPASQPTTAALDQAALERQFAETLTNANLVGFATDSRRPDAQPREDRYTIDRVTKVPGSDDNWVFTCRIPFRGTSLAVPLIIPVKWAGDTPVISVTDMAIPKMGTYTARVLIYRDNYVGTWSGRDHGGQLWGRIERTPTTAPATKPASP
jgi:hypothetical protein